MRTSIFLILLSTFLSCSDNVPEQDAKLIPFGYPVAEVLQSDSGIFRGITLGMKPEAVLQRNDKKKLTEQQPDYLFFEDSLAGKSGFTYEYSFNNEGLYEMHVDIYGRDSSSADVMTKRFENYFTSKFGEPDYFNDLLIWTVKTGTREAELVLADQTVEYSYGKISISVYDKAFSQPVRSDGDSVPGLDSVHLQ